MALFAAGRFAEAAALARTATARFPTHGFGWKVLGVALKQLGRNADALEPMRKAAALSPDDFEAHTNLGITLLELNRLDEAEASCRQALRINPDYAKAHFNLGATLYALGRKAEAEASYRRSLQVKPDYAEAHYNLGVALHDLGRMEEAAASYRRSLQFRPDHAQAHYNFGISLQALGRLDEAEESYRRALRIDPRYAQAHNNLGATLRERGRLEEAIAHFEQALILDAQLDKAKFGLCYSLYLCSLVDAGKARNLASRARQSFHGDPVMLRGISGILGDTDLSGDETAYTRKLFDGFAPTFESTLAGLKYDAPGALARELGLEDGTASRDLDILDAGCGTGLCGRFLRPAARTLAGVDLSPEMLRLAKDKGLYDALYEDDIVAFLRKRQASFDLIVLADVLIYIGDVRELVASIAFALRPQGRVAMSVECMKQESARQGFALHPSGRYQHAKQYLEQTLRENGLSVSKISPCALRVEHGKAVDGWIVVAE